jgi:hypothetical protein
VFTDTRPATDRTRRDGPRCRLSPVTLERLTELKDRTGASFDALIHRLVSAELARAAEATV